MSQGYPGRLTAKEMTGAALAIAMSGWARLPSLELVAVRVGRPAEPAMVVVFDSVVFLPPNQFPAEQGPHD
jgi:hypothetical protein